ncbi:hypothetical protein ACIHCQ_18405 [Streptomyces sp. NPDC052236]|uniref:hypothetical protein n=1 Tax=Streptomyces sp. NPDC052236 TaxID=3365686 RepID=UPI0037D18E81
MGDIDEALERARIFRQRALLHTPLTSRAGKASPQTLRVHAVDGGNLDLWFGPGPDQYGWSSHDVDIRVTAVTAGESAQQSSMGAATDSPRHRR